MDRATNQPCEITSNGLTVGWLADGLTDWRIRQTDGANAGQMSWAVFDLGSKTARVAQWLPQSFFVGGYSPLYYGGPGAATVTATIIVEDLVALSPLTVDIQSGEYFGVSNTGVGMVFESVWIGVSNNQGSFSGNTLYALEGCRLYSIPPLGPGVSANIIMVNCGLGPTVINGGDAAVFGGYSSDRTLNNWEGLNVIGGVVTIDMDFMSQSKPIRLSGGNTTLGYVCAFGSDKAGFELSGGTVIANNSVWPASSGQLWGAGSTTYGVEVVSTAELAMSLLQENAATLTGNLGDLIVGGEAVLPAWDTSTAAYTANRGPLSWVLLATAVAGGGFGGCVMHPGNGARVGLYVLASAPS
jgi:hypothetical protein